MKKKLFLSLAPCLILCAALLSACTANPKGAAPAEASLETAVTALPEESTPLEESTAPPESAGEGVTALYEFPEGSLSLMLPEGWEYEVQTKETKAREDGLVLCGIDFWPSAHPEMRLELGYWPDRIGMCGTGVTIEQIDFGGGLSAWRYTETIGGEVWLTLIYDHVGEGEYSFVLRGDIGEALWGQYEAQIMDIAGTAVMTVTETIAD